MVLSGQIDQLKHFPQLENLDRIISVERAIWIIIRNCYRGTHKQGVMVSSWINMQCVYHF